MFWFGSKGAPVASIQRKLGLPETGAFDSATDSAVRAYQRANGLTVDGIVGVETMKKMGLEVTPPDTRPPFPPLNDVQRQRLFGKFQYIARLDGSIRITDNWAEKNIVSVTIPALVGIPLYSTSGKPFSGNVRVHRLAVPAFKRFFAEIVRRGLHDRIKTFDGAFEARLVRGGKTLSNHAYGTAIDINAYANGLGQQPMYWCRPGSVIDLVPIAHECGLYWGGNFSRCDGMHFEVARLVA